MHTPRYLFLLVLSVIFSTATTVHWLESQFQYSAPDTDTLSATEGRLVERLLLDINLLRQSTGERMREDWSGQLQVIVPVMRQGHATLYELTNTLPDYTREQFIARCRDHFRDMESSVTETVRKNRELFGLSAEEAEEYLNGLFSDYGVVDKLPGKAEVLQSVLLQNLQLLEDFTGLYRGGCRMLSGPEFYPVLDVKARSIALGDTLATQVFIGSFFTIAEPEYIQLIVDGDTLPVGMDGRAAVTIIPTTRGQHQIESEVTVFDPVTGAAEHGSSRFTYEVR